MKKIDISAIDLRAATIWCLGVCVCCWVRWPGCSVLVGPLDSSTLYWLPQQSWRFVYSVRFSPVIEFVSFLLLLLFVGFWFSVFFSVRIICSSIYCVDIYIFPNFNAFNCDERERKNGSKSKSNSNWEMKWENENAILRCINKINKKRNNNGKAFAHFGANFPLCRANGWHTVSPSVSLSLSGNTQMKFGQLENFHFFFCGIDNFCLFLLLLFFFISKNNYGVKRPRIVCYISQKIRTDLFFAIFVVVVCADLTVVFARNCYFQM